MTSSAITKCMTSSAITKCMTSSAITKYDSISPSLLYPIIISVFTAFCMLSLAVFFITNKKCCKKGKQEDAESALLKQRMAAEQKKMAGYTLTQRSADHPQFQPVLQQEANDIAEEVKESYKSIGSADQPIHCCPDETATYIYLPQQVGPGNFAESVKTDHLPPATVVTGCEDGKESEKEKDATAQNNNEGATEVKPTEGNVEKKAMFEPNEAEEASDFKGFFVDRWMERGEENKEGSTSAVHSENNLSYGEVDSILTSVSRMDAQRVQRLRESRFYRKMLVPTEGECVEEGDISDDSIETETLDEFAKVGGGDTLSHEEIMQIVDEEAKSINSKKSSKKQEEVLKERSSSKNGEEVTERGIREEPTLVDKNQGIIDKIEISSSKKAPSDVKARVSEIRDKIEAGNKSGNNDIEKGKTESESRSGKAENESRSGKTESERRLKRRNSSKSGDILVQEPNTKINILRFIDKNSEMLFRVVKPKANAALEESRITASEVYKNRENNPNFETSREETISTTSRPKSLELRRKNTDLSLSVESRRIEDGNDRSCGSSTCSSGSSITSWKEIAEKRHATSSEYTEYTESTKSRYTHDTTHDATQKSDKARQFYTIKTDKNDNRVELSESALSEYKEHDSLSTEHHNSSINSSKESLSSRSKKGRRVVSRQRSFKQKRPRPPR